MLQRDLEHMPRIETGGERQICELHLTIMLNIKRNRRRVVSLAISLRPNHSSANQKIRTHKMDQMTVGLERTQAVARASDWLENAW